MTIFKSNVSEPTVVFVLAETRGLVKSIAKVVITVRDRSCGYETVTASQNKTSFDFTIGKKGSSQEIDFSRYVKMNSSLDYCPISKAFVFIESSPNHVEEFNLTRNSSMIYKQQTSSPDFTTLRLQFVTVGGKSIELKFEVLICGNEQVSSLGSPSIQADMARNMTIFTQKFDQQDVLGYKSLDQSSFAQWFSVNSTICGITNYVLCSDASCKEYLPDGYAKTRNVWIETVNATLGEVQPYVSTDTTGVSPQGLNHFDLSLVSAPNSNLTKRIKFKTNAIYNEKIYLAAVTRGYVFGTKEIPISVTCGAEKVSSEYSTEYFKYQITENTGTTQVLKAAYSQLFKSDQDVCSISSYSLEAHDSTKFAITDVVTPTETTQILSDYATMDAVQTIRLDSNKLKPGFYIVDIVAKTVGGSIARTPVLIEVKQQPQAINLAPQFDQPLENLELFVDGGDDFVYTSPKAVDIENNKVSFTFQYLDGEVQWAQFEALTDTFTLTVKQKDIPRDSEGIIKFAIVLSDDKTNLKTVSRMSLDIKFPAAPVVDDTADTSTDETAATTGDATTTPADTTTETDPANIDETIANTVTKPDDVPTPPPVDESAITFDIPAELLATIPKLEDIKVEPIKVVIPEVKIKKQRSGAPQEVITEKKPENFKAADPV